MTDIDAIRRRLTEFAAKHQVRRDGWCQECGRWPGEPKGPCPIADDIDALLAEVERLREALLPMREHAINW